jgi:hypothetical protein
MNEMKHIFEIFIPLLMMLMIFSPYLHATSNNNDSGNGGGSFNIVVDFGGVIGAVNSNANSTENKLDETQDFLGGAINSIPNGIYDLLTGSVRNSLQEFNSSLLTLSAILISVNPDPMLMFGLWQAIIIVISCFYLIVFLIVGFKFLMGGHNIQKREEAKESLKNAIIMIIAIQLSFYFYQLFLELATAITQFLWVTGFEQFFMNTTYTGAGIFMLFALAFSVIAALITLFARYLFLLMGVVIFPIGIFLYLIPSFKNWGKIIFNFFGIVLAMQFIDVILLVATGQIAVALTGEIGVEFIPVLGFTLIAITNTIILIYAIIKSAMSIMDNSPMLGMAIGALSGQVGMIGNALKGSGSK